MEHFRETLEVDQERAVLVAAFLRRFEFADDLCELTALAESAGAVVVDRFKQKLREIKSSTYMGKGKIELLAERIERFNANIVIFDNNLSPAQIRELEKLLEVKVIDRSELILDIFATRARTRQAKLQVELAQLEYTYPRLTRMWTHLDSIAGAAGGTAAGKVGGIGTRGTGEKQLEIDRRLVKKRITDLKRDLAVIDKRKLREIKGRSAMFKICLVGYTNAGKSTLLNALTGSNVFVEDRLFATLDTRTRKWVPDKGIEILVSDTVGFVNNLPHQLVASFKATLEEVVNADLLLHVVDASNIEVLAQVKAVNRVLAEIDCFDHPTIMVLNKADIVPVAGQLEMLQALHQDTVAISAKTNMGLNELSSIICRKFTDNSLYISVTCSPANGRLQSFLRAHADIIAQDYGNQEVVIQAVLVKHLLAKLKRLKPNKITIDTF